MRFTARIVRPIINDREYGPEEVRAHRLTMIALRDDALSQEDMEWAIKLSITIALLNALATFLERAEAQQEIIP